MAQMEGKSLSNPDETRTFQNGKIDVVQMGSVTVGRATLEPGWKWSTCVKPLAGTESCEADHMGYMLQGRMRVVMDDGTERLYRAGDAALIPAGHDAEVVGDEAVVFVDFGGAVNYARP
jgi:uncharacterized cupin superfamily protein